MRSYEDVLEEILEVMLSYCVSVHVRKLGGLSCHGRCREEALDLLQEFREVLRPPEQ